MAIKVTTNQFHYPQAVPDLIEGVMNFAEGIKIRVLKDGSEEGQSAVKRTSHVWIGGLKLFTAVLAFIAVQKATD